MLTNLLMEVMKKTFPPTLQPSSYGRVITISSRAHTRGTERRKEKRKEKKKRIKEKERKES